jgi:alpha-1,3-glucosyltransferase
LILKRYNFLNFLLFVSYLTKKKSERFLNFIKVLISDLVVFLPAVLLITRKLVKSSTNDYLILLLLVLLNPTLTLIDYGHFQYNSASLGLMLLALYFILSLEKQPLCKIKLSIASIFFTLALNYKQMELYHALPFFFFLLGSSLFRSTSFSNGFV